MNKITQIVKEISHTEKILVLIFAALAVTLSFNLVVGDPLLSAVFAEEGSSSSGESSGGGSDASSEESGGGSEASEDESSSDESSEDTESVASFDQESVVSVQTFSVEVSTLSEQSEPSVVSVFSGEEPSTVSVVSEASEISVASVSSGDNIEIFSNVELLDDDVAVVRVQKRLFFLFPVDIDQTVELDEDGTILDVRQSLFNLLLDLLSV